LGSTCLGGLAVCGDNVVPRSVDLRHQARGYLTGGYLV
jgi:hypothetical protein